MKRNENMIMQMTRNDKHDLYTASGLGKELSGALSESCQVSMIFHQFGLCILALQSLCISLFFDNFIRLVVNPV